jgi:hypothetical protein
VGPRDDADVQESLGLSYSTYNDTLRRMNTTVSNKRQHDNTWLNDTNIGFLGATL